MELKMINFFRVNFFSSLFLSLILCLFLTVSCGTNLPTSYWMSSHDKLKVLSTTAMINDLVQSIGGEFVDTLTLIKGEMDPHSYQLVKGDDEKLAFADIIFFTGLGLEHGPSLHQFLQYSSKSIGLGDSLKKQFPDLILYYNGQIDPHIWMDISLWKQTLPYIVKALSEKDPEHATIFNQNALKLNSELENLHQQIRQEMMKIPAPQRYLVTSHDAFNYFTRAYLATDEELRQGGWQKRFAAPEGLSPESQLSTAEIQFIIDHLTLYQIHMLFPESNVNKDSILKIVQAGQAKGLNLKMASHSLYADAMGKPGSEGDTYMKMIKYNADIILLYLWKNYP